MNIKELRLKYHLSQQVLSNKTGIPRPRIAKWEEAKGKPKQADFEILANFFAGLGEEVKEKQDTQKDEGQLALHKSILNLTESELKTKVIIQTLAYNDTEKTDVIKKLVSILERNYQAFDPNLPVPGQEGTSRMRNKKTST